MTNKTADKILQAVLADSRLQEYGEYNPIEFPDIESAIYSENCVVKAVALIIERAKEEYSEKEIYNEVNDFLKENI